MKWNKALAPVFGALLFLCLLPSNAEAIGVSRAGHDQLSCTTSGVAVQIIETASSVTWTQPTSQITLSNPTATIVRVYTGNGQPLSDGTPICNSSSCSAVSVTLPGGPGTWKCGTDSGTQAVFLLGVENH